LTAPAAAFGFRYQYLAGGVNTGNGWASWDKDGSFVKYVKAGVIALLFGRGADGATNAGDSAGDGIADPPPINRNNRPSLNADDGGYFRERAAACYREGALALP